MVVIKKNYKNILLLLLFLLTFVCLTTGLILPALTITQFSFFTKSHSILSTFIILIVHQHYIIGIIILLFSVIVPYSKIILLAGLYFLPHHGQSWRKKLVHYLMIIGKWSMLDVMIVAFVMISLQGNFFISTQLNIGIYFFASSVILSMGLTTYMYNLLTKYK
ncbi:MAG: paraquat-inducible protein A [Alphaproteobacteria bacterium]|nr:paraquat-inducible protein A [Alphaproteobacteria bacterium]